MRNEKGQALAAFVLILPLLFMLLAFVIDTGSLYLENKKLEDAVLTGLKYGTRHAESKDTKEKMRMLVGENVDGLTSLDVYQTDNQLKIHATKKKRTLVLKMLVEKEPNLNVIYAAYLEEGKWRIVKERG